MLNSLYKHSISVPAEIEDISQTVTGSGINVDVSDSSKVFTHLLHQSVFMSPLPEKQEVPSD